MALSMIYLELFWSFFQIGLFSFGGGYAAMPLIRNQVVDLHQWLSLTEFTDLITIYQMTPGPIAINSATFVGIQIAGLPGALVSTFGCVLPSCVIVSFLAWLYNRYKKLPVLQGILAALRPTVIALILSAGLSILLLAIWGQESFPIDVAATYWIAAALFGGGLFLLRKYKTNSIFVMLGCVVLGGVCYSLF